MQKSKTKLKTKSFLKQKINDVPLEEAHGGSGRRRMLLNHNHVASGHWEAIVKTFLDRGKIFDWHDHPDSDEVFIVLKGKGKYYCEEKVTNFNLDDIFITPARLKHKIEASEDCEFYFIRVKV